MTTVSSADYTFDPAIGGGPDLTFTLIGSAVPEPSTWAMLLIGFAGFGFAGYRRAKVISALAG
jgi:PEP-CTERM motif